MDIFSDQLERFFKEIGPSLDSIGDALLFHFIVSLVLLLLSGIVISALFISVENKLLADTLLGQSITEGVECQQAGENKLVSKKIGFGKLAFFLGLGFLFVPSTLFALLKAVDDGMPHAAYKIALLTGAFLGFVNAVAFELRRAKHFGKQKAKATSFFVRLLFAKVVSRSLLAVSMTSLCFLTFIHLIPSQQYSINVVGVWKSGEPSAVKWDTRESQNTGHQVNMTNREFSQRLLAEAPFVRRLELYGDHINDGVFRDLHSLQELEVIHIISKNLTKAGLKDIAKIQTLKRLKIESPIGDDSLHIIGGMTQLVALDISATSVTDIGLKHLIDLKLEVLQLARNVKTDIGLKSYLASVKPYPNLDLTGWEHVTPQAMADIKSWLLMEARSRQQIPHNASFKVLAGEAERIYRNIKLPTCLAANSSSEYVDGIKCYLSTLSSATALELRHNNLNGAGFEAFKLHPNLQYLNLSGNEDIHPDAYKYLISCEKLRILRLAGNRLSEESLKAISQISSLEFLDLSVNNISDESLFLLTNLDKLKKLYLNKREIQIETLTMLEKALPDCAISRDTWYPWLETFGER